MSQVRKNAGGNPYGHLNVHRQEHGKKKNKATQKSSEVAESKDQVLRKDPTPRAQSLKISPQAEQRHMDQLGDTGQDCDFWSVLTV